MVSSATSRTSLCTVPFLGLLLVLAAAAAFPYTLEPLVEFLRGGPLIQCLGTVNDHQSEFPCQRPVGHAVLEQTWWLPRASVTVDGWIADYGPLLPYLLLVTQLYTETVEQAAEEFGQWCPCPCWCVALAWWILMTLVRLVIFCLVRPYNEFFSDHIFLLNCMLAQIQMSLAMTSCRRDWSSEAEWWFYLEVLVAAPLVILIFFEAFMTSWLYHTLFASCMALLASSATFQATAFIWMRLLRSTAGQETDHSKKLIEEVSSV
ncbi:unnamed protein product [Symbiodinium natans]|uniref:Uncharacterized protein n=1 Tax=Symbiodinium natans TaxID=878477 RepID=A0A812V885_9DINO|nr:unnamed protein product [Symbiodinium natans]